LLERINTNERTVSKINDYYEVNLRAVSVRALYEQFKEMERALEQKASVLELKKVQSAISKLILYFFIFIKINR